MEEALTIAALGSLCSSTLARLNDIVSRSQTTNQTVTATISECTLLQVMLENVQNMGSSGHPARLREGTTLQQNLESILSACHLTLQTISSDTKKLEGTEEAPQSTSRRLSLVFPTRSTLPWKEGKMRKLLEQIRDQSNALQLVLHAYSTDSIQEMHETLDSVQGLLLRIETGASSIRSRRLLKDNRESVGDDPETNQPDSKYPFTASIAREEEEEEEDNRSRISVPHIITEDNVIYPSPGPPQPPPVATTLIPEDDEDEIPSSSIPNPFSQLNQRLQITPGRFTELSTSSRLTKEETMATLQQIQEVAGLHGHGAVQVILQKKNCNITSVLTQLKELRDLGSSEHFYSALLTLQHLEYNIKHTVNSLIRLRDLGTVDEYMYCLAFLKRNNYDVLKTQGDLESLKRTCTTPEDYHYTLHYLSTLEYNVATTLKNLADLRRRWARNAEDYSCIIGLLDHCEYELEVTVNQLDQLVPNAKRKLIGRDVEETPPLRRSVTLQLLRKNKYDSTQTMTEIQYLCDGARFPGVPVIPLKVLEGVDYDFRTVVDIFKWLKNFFGDNETGMKVLQENSYRVEDLKSSIIDYQTRLYGEHGNSQLLGTLRYNGYNAKRFIAQHQWAVDLLTEAPELDILFPSFLNRGWHIERLKKFLGPVQAERIQTLLAIGENEEDVINRGLDNMKTALIGIGLTGVTVADKLFRESLFDFRVMDHLLTLREAARDNWGMRLMLSFFDKDPDHDVQLAVAAYLPLGDIFSGHKSDFWGFILDYFHKRKISATDYSRLLSEIWENVCFHLNGSMKDAGVAYEHVLYAIGSYNYDLEATLIDLRSHGYLPDLLALAQDARRLNQTIGGLVQARTHMRPSHQRSATVLHQRTHTHSNRHRNRSQV